MSLAPALGQDLSNIVGVQTHVHGVIRIVDVADLALAICLNGASCEQGQSVLFHAGSFSAELLGTSLTELLQDSTKSSIAMP